MKYAISMQFKLISLVSLDLFKRGYWKIPRVFLFLLLLLLSFLAALRHVEFLDQGSDQSCSFNLSLGCGNARFLTHSACPRDPKMPLIPLSDRKMLNYIFGSKYISTGHANLTPEEPKLLRARGSHAAPQYKWED